MYPASAKRRWGGGIPAGMAVVFLIAGPVCAQWSKLRLPGTPRTPDGAPNLAAPAPRTPDGKPDLSGIWRKSREGTKVTAGNIAADGIEIQFHPWAEALYKARLANNGLGVPSERCLPHQLPKAYILAEPTKIVQTPQLIVILHEEFNNYRQVFTDGRQFPPDLDRRWMGYSIGKWEGDTLVVDTRGFVDETWLDFGGHPATDALHFVERYRRRDFGHLDIQFTVDDSKAYMKPWTFTVPFDVLPDTELIEQICDNEKDAAHLVGK
jgi:hypothetical protein